MEIDYSKYIMPANKDYDFVILNTKQKFIQDIVFTSTIINEDINFIYNYHMKFDEIYYN